MASGMVVYNLADGGHKNAITSVVRLSPSEVCVMWCRSKKKGAAGGAAKIRLTHCGKIVFLTFKNSF